MEFLEASGISCQVNGRDVLKNINLSLRQHEMVAVSGETGSGKTTLLKVMAGLLQPNAGRVTLQGKKVLGPADQLIPGDPRMAYLSQYFELRNHYRVQEELYYGNQLGDEEAALLFELCRIDHLLNRYTHELSGGEKQRIATAKALLSRPQMLLLDEPFSNLDPFHKSTMRQVIDDVRLRLGITVVFVDHDPRDTLSQSDRVVILHNGQLLQEGLPKDIYLFPANDYVAALFGSFTAIPPAWQGMLPVKLTVLRPEHLILDTSDPMGLPGKVIRSFYYGAYHELTVQTPQGLLYVRAEAYQETGTPVTVSLNRRTIPT